MSATRAAHGGLAAAVALAALACAPPANGAGRLAAASAIAGGASDSSTTVAAPAGDLAPDRLAPPVAGAARGPAPHDALTGRDLAFAGIAGAALAGAFAVDRRLDLRIEAEGSTTARDLARTAEHFGNPAVVGPALIAVDLAGRLTRRPDLAAATERIGLSVGVAGVAALALKEVAGRARPVQRPGDPDDNRAFSGWASFPSGHTTVAFAWAAALDAETGARWVPWVAYPVAAAVGWSRVRDREHWPSDVVAGAALGGWLARHADARLRESWRHPLHLGLVPDGSGARLRAFVKF